MYDEDGMKNSIFRELSARAAGTLLTRAFIPDARKRQQVRQQHAAATLGRPPSKRRLRQRLKARKCIRETPRRSRLASHSYQYIILIVIIVKNRERVQKVKREESKRAERPKTVRFAWHLAQVVNTVRPL